MEKPTAFIIIVAILAAAFTACFCTHQYYQYNRDMADKGYEEVTVAGKQGVVWQKRQ